MRRGLRGNFWLAALVLVLPSVFAIGVSAQASGASELASSNGYRGTSHVSDPAYTPGSGWADFEWVGPGTFDTTGPFTFTTTTSTVLEVTDLYCPGDRFAVFDHGTELGDTSVPGVVTCTGAYEQSTPNLAYTTPDWSHGSFSLGAGSHSLTFEAITAPFGEGGAAFQVLPPQATNAHCGTVLKSSLTLNGTLTCRTYDGDALTIGSNGVTLNLGGHAIFEHSSDGGTGVGVDGFSNATLENGRIVTAYTGVYAEGAPGFTVTGVTFSAAAGVADDDYGIYVTAEYVRTTIRDNTISDMNEGLALTGLGSSSNVSGNDVTETKTGIDATTCRSTTFSNNTVTDSLTNGIRAEDTTDVSYTSNETSYNGIDGMYLTGPYDTTISRAHATYNDDDGVYIDDPGAGVSVSIGTADDNGEYGFYATSRVGGAVNIAVGDPGRCVNVLCA